MIKRKSEVDYLIHLLSCALNGKEPIAQEGIDYSVLLTLARKHQVYNIIFPLIKDMDSVPAEDKAEFRTYHLNEIQRMLTINNEREQIYSILDEKGIAYMPLKGLIIKHYYPKESMRQMSDNDILFDATFRDDVANIMKSMHYKATATGENSDDYHKAPYCTFEFHRTLFFKQADFCPVFDDLWERATKDDEHPAMYHMGLDDVYIYSVCHMYKHFSTAGCGIRFLADHYLFLKKENDNLNWDYINQKLDSFGILDYEKKSRILAFKLYDEEELDDEELTLLETYINFGIYGDGNIRLGKSIEKLADGGSMKKAKIKYIFERLFPSKATMVANNRILEKHIYLLPAMYIIRLFKGLIHREKSMGELNDIKNIKEK